MNDLFFVVGAPRSGTKIFRDTLEAHSSITTTDHPLEEIWSSTDNLPSHDNYDPKTMSETISERIRQQFQKKRRDTDIFVEKNVRNSLRIPYIQKTLPEANFIHIMRDPYDVVVSLHERWRNPIDWDYYLSLRGLQLSPGDILYYSFHLGWKFIRRLITGKEHVDIWGPHYPGLKNDLAERSLLEVCALQWKHCVEGALKARTLTPDNYFELHYETLMDSPGSVLRDLASFMGIEDDTPWLEFADENFRTSSIGRAKAEFSDEQLRTVHAQLDGLPEKLGYDSDVVS